jgi:hypothetical protein
MLDKEYLPEKPTYEELEDFANEYAEKYSIVHSFIIELQELIASSIKYKHKVEAIMEKLMFLKSEFYKTNTNQKGNV